MVPAASRKLVSAVSRAKRNGRFLPIGPAAAKFT
jgi:hypothetical protein